MIGEKKQNRLVREASGSILGLSEDEKLRERLFDRQSAINDYNSDMTRSRAEGYAEGYEEGLAEAQFEWRRNVSKKLLQEGWTVERIAKLLEVAVADVEIWLNDQ